MGDWHFTKKFFVGGETTSLGLILRPYPNACRQTALDGWSQHSLSWHVYIERWGGGGGGGRGGAIITEMEPSPWRWTHGGGGQRSIEMEPWWGGLGGGGGEVPMHHWVLGKDIIIETVKS